MEKRPTQPQSQQALWGSPAQVKQDLMLVLGKFWFKKKKSIRE